MNEHARLAELRGLLVSLYADRREWPRLIADAGLPQGRIDLGGKPDTVWHEILQEVMNQQSLPALFDAVGKDFPQREDLRQWRLRLCPAEGGSTASPLRIPLRVWFPDRSPPGALLCANNGIVPFHGREKELADLLAWCERDLPVAVRLYTGKGGMGKTRLAIELCTRMQSSGWLAGFVDARDPAAASGALAGLPAASRALIVVDYAETGAATVADALRRLLAAPLAHCRVVLLARAAGDWWERLRSEGGGVEDLLRGPASGRFALGPLALTVAAREDTWHRAAERFADALKMPVPAAPAAPLDAAWFDRVLLVHSDALAAVEGVQVQGEDGILDRALARERRFWRDLAAGAGLAATVAAGIGRAMAAFTLGGGARSEREAVAVLKRLAFFEGQSRDVLHAVVRLLHDAYPGDDRWIEPVLPDLLGEHLVQAELDDNPDELYDLTLAPAPG